MRLFFVYFIGSWLIGLVMGALQVDRLLLTPALVFLGAWWMKSRRSGQVLVAGVSLLGLGFLYAQSVEFREMKVACGQSSEYVGWARVDRILRAAEDRTQYVVVTDDGCTTLVTAGIYPVYGPNTRVLARLSRQGFDELPAELEGYGDYLARQGITTTVFYPTVLEVEQGRDFIGWRVRVAGQINQVFREPLASFIRAMWLGERGGLPTVIQESWRRAGVNHILAISGLHVAMVVGGLVLVMSGLPVNRWGRLGLLVVGVWLYVVGVGAPISAVRAGWFWTLLLVAYEYRRLMSWLSVLLFVVLILISFHPPVIFDVGFQLSMAAVTGIGVTLFLGRSVVRSTVVSRWWRVVGDSMLVSLGALLGTLPVSLMVFGQVSWVGVIANVVVLPIVPVILTVSLVAVPVSVVWLPLGILMGALADVGWKAVVLVTESLGGWPGAVVVLPVSDVGLVIGWIFLWVLIGHGWLRYQGRSWRELWE